MSTGTQLAPTQEKGTRLAKYLASDTMKKRIAGALPKHMTADRAIRMALTSASKTPKLLDCSIESVGLALLQASQLGVEINGRDAHLVPFKGECQLIVDYKGFVQLAYRSGIVKSIKAKAVHEKDAFDFSEGTDEHLTYKAYDGDEDPGPLTHAWAMVKLLSGGECWVVMNRRQIMQRRAVSKNPQNWDKYPEAYWAKTAVREMAKWMPQVAELQQFQAAVETDEAIDVGSIEIASTEPIETKSAQLADSLKQQSALESVIETRADRAAEEYSDPASADEATTVAQWREEVAGLQSLGELAEAKRTIPQTLSPTARQTIASAIEMREAAIRGSRGQRANKQQRMYPDGQVASEEGT